MIEQKNSFKAKPVQVGDTISFSSRSVTRSCISREIAEGKGAVARRSIGSDAFPAVDPFIMLDDFTVNQPAGFLDHAHRGLETVTFLRPDSLGSMCHEDFLGHKGTLNPGDVQFMNAGKGIMHAEMPVNKSPATGLQLWVNLPSKDKMGKPKYTELPASKILKVIENDVTATVLSGSCFLGIGSYLYSHTQSIPAPVSTPSSRYHSRCPTKVPTHLVFYSMGPNTILDHAFPEDWTGFIYSISGAGWVGSNALSRNTTNDLDCDAEHNFSIGPHTCAVLTSKSVVCKTQEQRVITGFLPQPVLSAPVDVMSLLKDLDIEDSDDENLLTELALRNLGPQKQSKKAGKKNKNQAKRRFDKDSDDDGLSLMNSFTTPPTGTNIEKQPQGGEKKFQQHAKQSKKGIQNNDEKKASDNSDSDIKENDVRRVESKKQEKHLVSDSSVISHASAVPSFVHSGVRVCSGKAGFSFFLAVGQPIGEPVVHKGPFVMNTEAQVEKAFRDWQTQTNGFEAAKKWRSEIAHTGRQAGQAFTQNTQSMQSTKNAKGSRGKQKDDEDEEKPHNQKTKNNVATGKSKKGKKAGNPDSDEDW